MKKNSLISMIIAIIIIGILVGINIIGINRNSTLTCIRDNNDKVVYTFDDNGIKNIKINGKEISEVELTEYNLSFASDFSWNEMNNDNYLETVNDHIEDVTYYEEFMLEESSKCDF